MKTTLSKFTTTGGYLEKSPITFKKGLNCIIGSPGTCKSTLIESIRFAFNTDPQKVKTLIGNPETKEETSFYKKVSATLGAGSVRCEIISNSIEGETFLSIEREIDSEPRIYKDGVKNFDDPSILSRIEIYSQGDLQKIAEQENLRLQLIDRPNLAKINDISNKQKLVVNELKKVGPIIKNLRAQIEQLKIQIKPLPELHFQLNNEKQNRPQLSKELNEQRSVYLKRKRALEIFQNIMKIRDELLHQSTYDKQIEQLNQYSSSMQNLELIETSSAIQSISDLKDILDKFSQLREVLVEIPLIDVNLKLQEEIEKLNEGYFQLRIKEEKANESLKKEDELKKQIQWMENRKIELQELEKELEENINNRAQYRQQVKMLGSEKYQLRLTEVEKINSKHGDLVVLTLQQGALGGNYLKSIEALLGGSRLRNQNEIAYTIAELLNPEDLVDLVESGNADKLASVLDRDLIQITRLMSYLIDSEELYELEAHVFEDKLSISMFDEGESKPVRDLSNGQKATALLPLILREAEYPLIFDQPEDDLDNRFIFNSLVKTILELKEKRQIIFVTHNANIPVLGEAENIVVMKMDSPTKAAPADQGDVNTRQQEIVDLLEGGKDAFRERQKRYGTLLASNG